MSIASRYNIYLIFSSSGKYLWKYFWLSFGWVSWYLKTFHLLDVRNDRIPTFTLRPTQPLLALSHRDISVPYLTDETSADLHRIHVSPPPPKLLLSSDIEALLGMGNVGQVTFIVITLGGTTQPRTWTVGDSKLLTLSYRYKFYNSRCQLWQGCKHPKAGVSGRLVITTTCCV